MDSETGPEISSESETAFDNDPEAKGLVPQHAPPKEDRGGATDVDLDRLVDKGVGGEAEEESSQGADFTSGPEGLHAVSARGEEILREASDENTDNNEGEEAAATEEPPKEPTEEASRESGRQPLAKIEPKRVAVPADIAAQGEEAVRQYLEATNQPTEQAAPEPAEGESEPAAEPTQEQKAVAQTVEDTRGQIIEDRPVAEPEEPKSVLGRLRGFFGGQPTQEPTTTPGPEPDTTPPPEAGGPPEQPPPPPTKEGASAPEPEDRSSRPEKPEEKPRPSTEEEAAARYEQLESGSKLTIGKIPYQVDKIEEEEIVKGEKTIRLRLIRLDSAGNPTGESLHQFKHEIEAELEKQIRAERKVEEKASEKTAQIAAKAESERQNRAQIYEKSEKEKGKVAKKQAEKEGKIAQREKYETEKAQRKESLAERIQEKRAEFEVKKRVGRLIFRGQEPLKFVSFDPERRNPYVFIDENKNRQYLSREQIDNILRTELKKEDKAFKEQRPQTEIREKGREVASKGLETAGQGAKALIEAAEKNVVGRILLRQGKAVLNSIDLRDKHKVAWLAGAAIGGVSNFALVSLTSGPGLLASKFIRSGIVVGLTRGVTFGINAWRDRSMKGAFEQGGLKDKSKIAQLTNKTEKAQQLIRESDMDAYYNEMGTISKEAMLKEGQLETWATDLSRAALIQRLESLNTRFHNYNNGLRSFTAGVMAGSVLTSLGFLGESVLTGGGPDVPHQAPTPGVPEHTPTPGVPEHTPTPGVPESTPTPTPIPDVPEIPVGAEVPSLPDILTNPELSNTFEIGQGDTVGQLLIDHGFENSSLWDATPDNAELLGTHIYANYDMLQGMHEQVAAAGIAVEDFPTQEELARLITAASAGNAESMHQLTEALHWVPAGGNINVLTPEGLEAAKRALGVAG